MTVFPLGMKQQVRVDVVESDDQDCGEQHPNGCNYRSRGQVFQKVFHEYLLAEVNKRSP